jgi:NADH-quinone oxidoreductase subunit I
MDRSPLAVIGEMREAAIGFWSLIVGLAVTGNQFFRRTVTVHYPRQTVDNLSTFRGPLELVPSTKDPSAPSCIVCSLCAQNCPSNCLEIVSHTEEIEVDDPKAVAETGPDGEKKAPAKKKRKVKVLDSFTQRFHLCSLCGMCVQNCPQDAIRFSHDVYRAGTSRADFEFELLANMRKKLK